jgi:hypothetical protein
LLIHFIEVIGGKRRKWKMEKLRLFHSMINGVCNHVISVKMY